MTTLDWHAERGGLTTLELLDAAPESAGIDLAAVRSYRLGRVRAQMAAHGVDALILSDAVNIRYATGTRNMQVFTSRNAPARYLIVTAARTVLYEFTGCQHLADGFETIDEVRPALTASFVAAGADIAARERRWATEIGSTLRELVGNGATLGVERLNAGAVIALTNEGFTVTDAQAPVERARSVKSSEELKCIVASLRATEAAVDELREAVRPGITENELWSVLHRGVITRNGDYCETRLLNSGGRSNPWFQECSTKVIEANELVALDTDVVGCHGYYSDFSRTFHAGPDAPSPEQRRHYRLALEQVQHNVALLRPGLGFRDYAAQAFDVPAEFHANRYYLSAHGVGMTGEYPYLYHRADFERSGYDGELVPGMTLCVESYMGAEGGPHGVKLEQQVLITETGHEVLSRFPFETTLMD